MTVRRSILIEPYEPFRGQFVNGDLTQTWCAREYVQHGDESRTTRVLHTAPTREQVADWLAERHREARAQPQPAATVTPCNNKEPHTAHLLSGYNVCLGIKQ